MKKTEEMKQARASVPGDAAPYFFHEGTSCRAYDYLGVHREKDTFVFRVWAPHADEIALCGDFTDWRHDVFPLSRVTDGGVWETAVEATRIKEGQCYQYYIRTGSREVYKADPYGFCMETPPERASVVTELGGYHWRDSGWMRYRRERFTREVAARQPINIYELHAGSWRRHADGRPFRYPELAAELVTYVKQMGYTHVELMPLAEHPFEGSWGYQVCGYFAPTSRYGTPQELMSFVDTLHEAGIGVIFDWVPAHFPKDAHGLFEFDGRPLYEYADPARMEHPSWGTRCFDLGCPEVQSFLLSNAYFWVEKYHADGLRVDAVSSMLYLDYERKDGEWTPNAYGDNRNLDAVAFFQKLNRALAHDHPDVITVAEESTAWRGVTDLEDGGLGFTFKWNMGWMNDSLSYLREDPLFRKYHHNKLTFPITYAFGERYILPISHDETVHGKRSLLDRNVGEYEQKFAGTRAFLTYLMTQPGKKLTFMGCEIGQFCEWDHTRSVEWFLLQYDMHAALQLFVSELNHFYLEQPALWQRDADPEGFRWIDANDAERSICSYRRRDADGNELVVLLNFTPVERRDYALAVPKDGVWEEIFNSDDERFGGTGCVNAGRLVTSPYSFGEYRHAIRVNVPPLSGTVYQRDLRSRSDICASHK